MSEPAELRVRPARADDAATIADFNVRLAAESEALTLDDATVRAGVEALLADPAKGAYLVAEQAGALVGQLMLTIEWSDWRNGPIYWLQSVYVVPAMRGAGVFRALWDHALAAAREAGARFAHPSPLRLYASIRDHFLPVIEQHFPHLAAKYREAYRGLGHAPRRYAAALSRRFRLVARRHNIPVYGREPSQAIRSQLGLWS